MSSRSHSNSAAQPLATIVLRGQQLSVRGLDPRLRALVDQEMHVARTELVAREEGGYDVVTTQHRLAVMGRDDRVLAPAGLLRRIQKLLQAEGCRVRVQNTTRWPQLEREDYGLLNDEHLSEPDRAFLSAISGRSRGQVYVPTGQRATELTALLAAWYGGSTIAVVAADGERQALLYRHLTHLLDQPVNLWVRNDNDAHGRRRVCVLSLARFARLHGRPRRFPIVVFADVESATASVTTTEFYSRYRRTLVFTILVAEHWHRADDGLLLEAVSGSEIYRERPAHDRLWGATVQFVQPPLSPSPGRCDALERKQIGIWHNLARNRYVASLAKALAARDEAALLRHGLLLDDTGYQLPEQPRVAVLVESPAHARQLGKLLWSWRVCTACPGTWLAGRDTSSRLISTHVAAAQRSTACRRTC